MSMAASTIASSQLHTKLSNLSFTSSPLPLPTHFLSKPFKPLKPLKLGTQFPNCLSLLFLPRRSQCAFAALDSFDTSQDEEITAQDDPEAESREFESGEEFDDDDDVEEEEVKSNASNEQTKLYVGNLPYSTTSSQLAEIFGEAGRVTNAEIIYDRVTDRSRGFGFVTMGSVADAKEAIRMFNGSQIGGRSVRVNFPEVPKGGEREVMETKIRSGYKSFVDSPHKIYAGNLGWGITSQGLKDVFANQPGLLSAKVIYERDTGRSRGFGFVSFESAEDANAAINAMNGQEVEGRPLRLNLAAERSRPVAFETSNQNNFESSESNELLSSISS